MEEENVNEEGFADLLDTEADTTEAAQPVAEAEQGTGAEPVMEQDTAPAEDAAAEEPPAEDGGGIQKRLDKLTWEKYEARREADRLKLELEEARSAKTQHAASSQSSEGKPQEDSFDDYSEYVEALGRWSARQEWESREAERVQKQSSAEKEKNWNSFHSKLQKDGRDKYRDKFDVVFKDPKDGGPVVSPAMLEGIMQSEIPADVVFWLSQNRDESARIADMSDTWSIARELSGIEHRLKSSQPTEARSASRAPSPIRPVGSTGTVTSDEDRMSMDDFYKSKMRERIQQLNQ